MMLQVKYETWSAHSCGIKQKRLKLQKQNVEKDKVDVE